MGAILLLKTIINLLLIIFTILPNSFADTINTLNNIMSSSWVTVSAESHFPIQNLPFGIFSTRNAGGNSLRRAGVAIGDFVLDLMFLHREGFFDGIGFSSEVFCEPTLNSFMGLERKDWRAARSRIRDVLASDGSDSRLRSNEVLQRQALIPMADVVMHMPADIGDYTDFYSSREHATNVGVMFRGLANALQPNWLHLPVGYHGRASSVVLSGTDVVRPNGQVAKDKDDHSKGSTFTSCKLMDFELEMAIFLGGKSNPLGRPLTIAEAEDHIFGVVLMNDWSARDIQAWEYVPLGPFTAKNFMTSISPWIVSFDALEPFRTSTSAGAVQADPDPLPYLQDPNYGNSSFNIGLEVLLQGPNDTRPSTISTSNLRYMYWNFKQQLVHHSITGCNMRAGDLLGTGTISGPTPDSLGSMLELSWRGSRDVPLANSVEEPPIRKFLKDGDTVTMTGFAQGEGYRVGFGSVSGKVLPAGSPVGAPAAPAASASGASQQRIKLYSYWRSTSSWRVRLALSLKNIEYEYVPIDLLPLVGNTTAHLPSELTTKNPLEQVPLLEITGEDGSVFRLTQSLAIIEYLEDTFPGRTSILPKHPNTRARARQIAEIVNSGIQPLQNLSVLRQVKEVELIGNGGTKADGKAFGTQAIANGLAAIETLVPPASSGLFAAGTDVPSIADICLVPQVYNAKRFNIDLSGFPNIVAIVAKCEALPSFQKATPESQPDAKA